MMLIKEEKQPSFYNKYKDAVNGRHRSKWFLPLLFLGSVFLVTNLGSIYYGMHLHKTGESMTLTRWASSIAHHKLSFIPNFFDGLQANPERLLIDIKFKHFQKIAHKREEALKIGHLVSSSNDWVPAQIRHNGRVYKVKMRLKGDTPDHWKRDDRWSFKIKASGDNTLFGMKRFAIQDPRTRQYLNEWYFHKLQEYLGLIHLRYDFVDVTINGKHQGVYAIEENFDKRVIENNKFREGPIIRFASGYNWGNRLGTLPILLGASIESYQQNKMMANSELAAQFNKAKNLLELFRQGELTFSQVFDVTKLARFFAISDLLGYYHASGLDNLKFYYNPITSLIEPVGYDFNKFIPLSKSQYGLIGAGKRIELTSDGQVADTRFRDYVFTDLALFKEYIKTLEQISERTFLNDFFEKTKEEASLKLRILHKSNPWYNFDNKQILYENQKYIRNYLSPQKSLQAYFDGFSNEDGALSLVVRNIHSLHIEIVDVRYNGTTIFQPNGDTILPATFKLDPIKYSSMKFRVSNNFQWSRAVKDSLRVRFKIPGSSSTFEELVHPSTHLDNGFLTKDLMRQQENINEFEFLTVDEKNKTITFKPGAWTLERNLIIGRGYQVIASPGLQLNLTNSAKILSYSPMRFIGSEEKSIVISSLDSTGQGIAVLNAHRKSLFENVIFDNLSNPSQDGWSLTGALTFYESPVKFSHCQFINNRCEDALNIFRTDFEITHCLFKQTQSDAFDGDFVKGKIVHSSFVNCGNDAIDISGSIVELNNIFMDGIGDKGLSAGENSQMTAEHVKIKNAELAISSKDISNLTARDIDLSHIKVGFTAFQKKSEFGPAVIKVTSLEMTDVEIPFLIEDGSKMILDKKSIASNGNNIKDILYGAQYGKSSKSQ